MRDQDFGIVRARAFGTYDFRIVNPSLFLKEVAGTDHHFRLDEFAETMRSRIVSVFSEALAESNVPVLDVATRYSELGESLMPLINAVMEAKYGIEFTSFVVENVSVPPEVEEAIDKRSSMSAVGNLNDYVKFQMAQGMERGTSSTGGMATEMAVGMALAQQMVQQGMAPGGGNSAGSGGAPAAANAPNFNLMGIDGAAQLLGVTEADVLATIEAGDLKAKKIGSTYRITRANLEAFINS